MTNKGPSQRTGRRKIETSMIPDKNKRQVCFSKRRNGLMKKASELSILCGAEIAVIVLSPCGRSYTFGSPSVDSIVHRFLDRSSPSSALPSQPTSKVDPAHLRSTIIQKLHQEQQYELLLQPQAKRKRLASSRKLQDRTGNEKAIAGRDGDANNIDHGQLARDLLPALQKLKSPFMRHTAEEFTPDNTAIGFDDGFPALPHPLPVSDPPTSTSSCGSADNGDPLSMLVDPINFHRDLSIGFLNSNVDIGNSFSTNGDDAHTTELNINDDIPMGFPMSEQTNLQRNFDLSDFDFSDFDFADGFSFCLTMWEDTNHESPVGGLDGLKEPFNDSNSFYFSQLEYDLGSIYSLF